MLTAFADQFLSGGDFELSVVAYGHSPPISITLASENGSSSSEDDPYHGDLHHSEPDTLKLRNE